MVLNMGQFFSPIPHQMTWAISRESKFIVWAESSIATTAQHPQRRVCFIVDKPRIFDLKLPNRWSIDRPRWQSECP